MEVPCAVLAYPARLTDRPTRRDDETNEHNGERIETTRDERAERGDDLVTLVTAVWCVSLCTAGYDLPIYTRDGTLVGVSSETETETRNFSLLASLNSTVYAGRETESCEVLSRPATPLALRSCGCASVFNLHGVSGFAAPRSLIAAFLLLRGSGGQVRRAERATFIVPLAVQLGEQALARLVEVRPQLLRLAQFELCVAT